MPQCEQTHVWDLGPSAPPVISRILNPCKGGGVEASGIGSAQPKLEISNRPNKGYEACDGGSMALKL